jgi:hypothetical protein
MDELIGRPAIKAGIHSAIAENAIGIVLGFLRNEGPSDKFQALGADQMGKIIAGTPGLSQFA